MTRILDNVRSVLRSVGMHFAPTSLKTRSAQFLTLYIYIYIYQCFDQSINSQSAVAAFVTTADRSLSWLLNDCDDTATLDPTSLKTPRSLLLHRLHAVVTMMTS